MPEPNNLKIKNPSWWRRRARLEKILIITVCVLILLIIILSLIVARLKTTQAHTNGTSELCLSEDCIRVAAKVLEKIDTNIDPCEDFYQFSCGNFIKNTIIPEDKSEVTSFSIVGDQILELMHNLVKKPIVPTDNKAFVLVKTLYQACMNLELIDKNSVKDLKKIIQDTGGWPVIEGSEWKEENFNWISTSYKLMKMGFRVNSLLNFAISADTTNSTTKALFLDQIDIKLSPYRRNGFNETIVQQYNEFMTELAIIFGADAERAKEEMKDVTDLIISLTRITLKEEERRNLTLLHNPHTIQELEDNFDYVPWLEYINTMLDPYKKLTKQDIVLVQTPSYYQKLKDVLSNTPLRTLANYMYWSIVETGLDSLDRDIRNLVQDFSRKIFNVSTSVVRWKECTQKSIRLYVASGALFVQNAFSKESKKEVLEINDLVRKEFKINLQKIDWMDQETKKRALEKLNAMHVYEAYPEELLDVQKLDDFYQNLSFNASDYLRSQLNISLFKNLLEYSKLGQTFDKSDWKTHSYVVLPTAYYTMSENSIEILAGILRDVFFGTGRPKYMNFGAIGQVIGHETTHGFDDVGKQHDKDGNLFDWWEENTKNKFDAKRTCIINQYGNITDPEVKLNLNGMRTQGENIADNGGIKLAYLAYKTWIQQNGPEQSLPGLPFTPEQMFWISAGNVWCTVENLVNLEVSVKVAEHSPNRYRVNVPLMNSEFFAKDFNCAKNTKMNPEHKCKVW